MNLLSFKVLASRTSNDHELRIFIHGEDYLELCDPALLGIDPPEFFAQATLYQSGALLVGRCECGTVGCGDEFVTVEFSDSSVTWTGRRRPPSGMTFRLDEYHAALTAAREDTSWETVERRAERLVGGLDFAHFLPSNVSFEWACARTHPDRISVSLKLDDGGRYQLVCSAPWDHQDVSDAVRTIRDLLNTPMKDWRDVVYYPQSPSLPRPSAAGPAWKPWTR